MNGLGTALSNVVADLVNCVCEALNTDGAGQTCWCGFYPGSEVSWDYCGSCSGDTCGMGYVRIVGMHRSTTFPEPDLTVNCNGPVVVQFAVGALRCVPVADDSGRLPNEAMIWESSLGVLADSAALYVAADCCMSRHLIGEYVPLGPQGGCVGGEWTVWVSL